MFAHPSHRLGKLYDCLNFIQNIPIPVMFQNSPDSLNRVVFAVIGRVIGQSKVEFMGNGKLNHALHELSTTRMILWAIILIDE
jgi:hypothetical protein